LPRLLVIDDDPAVRAVVMRIARSAGFDATGCDGVTQLAECLDAPADLIILDLVMPVLDGIEIIERLARTHSAARLVLVSGQERRVLASASRYAAAHGLKVAAQFTKPFVNDEVRACLIEQKAALSTSATSRLRRAPVEVRAAAIDEALRAGELLLHYQPQVSLASLDWVGVEALARWQHPEFGLLTSESFIPVAEREPELIKHLTDHLIGTACRTFAGAMDGFTGRVALNVPANALVDEGFPDRLLGIASAAGIATDRLVLEVTETSKPAEPLAALAVHTRLRMRGVSLALDDYGTGHSGLERLHRFPMDELKIDLNFVRESIVDPEARAIVHNSIALARDLGMRCVAEGVENLESMRMLAALRCGFAQGYFVGRPMPKAQLSDWYHGWQLRRANLLEELAS
jgi:EAL domain-containing protein (putative c-di-GMP-specific phosphodiesterase class I)/FixJ family two-component response regulator